MDSIEVLVRKIIVNCSLKVNSLGRPKPELPMDTGLTSRNDTPPSSTMLEEDTKSVVSSTSGGSDTRNNNNLAQSEEAKLLASTKNNRIVCLRVLFVIFWLVSASLLSYAVYKFISDDQVEEFHQGFQVQATKVLDRFLESMESDLGALDTLSTSITSFAMATGATFPNVTLGT
jgi:hypothetical protein